ncbi:MAG TPA: SNF2-related protein [Pseudonocardia sp.]|uniref:SNF2-related protein n=1 Tax=Pseudonocardia sp. TaxID=60912 RepID=UPI002ED86F5F
MTRDEGDEVLAIHGLWSRGRGLLLWAEDSDRPVLSPSLALRSARPHPFALPADQLAAIHPGKPGMATLLLPSVRRAPVDSPELARAAPRRMPRSAPTLMAWSVPVVVVDPAELADLAEEVRYGASVTHLRALVEFAEDLADRGRVIPGVRPREGGAGARAVWRPVLTGPDAVVRRALVAATPPVARAEQVGPPGMAVLTGLAGQEPDELLDDALDALVDAAVRDRLGRAEPPPVLVPPRRGSAAPPPAVDAWLAALTSGDGCFEADPAEVRDLGRVLTPWVGVVDGPSGPAQGTFRLTEAQPLDDPADPDLSLPDTVWRLEFLLRSAEDPSLLVPAEQIWNSPSGLRRWIEQPQEVLLAELARASVIYPELAEALREPRPSELELGLHGAYRFLSEVAGRLDQAGFGVLLPAWWGSSGRAGAGQELGLSVSASSTPSEGVVVAGGLSRERLARFDWRLAVGDVELTEDEILELVATKAPLVRLRGQWVTVDSDRLRRGLEFLRAAPTRASTAAEVLAVMTGLTSGHGDQPAPLPVTSVRADGWLGDLLAGGVERTLRPVHPPPGFLATLRPYQQRGLSWLAFLSSLGLGACLADDMGLGKTVQLLALESTERSLAKTATHPAGNPDSRAVSDLREVGESRRVTLLLCPMSLVGNWQREAAKFAPGLRVYAHHGAGRPHGAQLAERLAAADLVVTTYGTATRDIEELAEYSWHRVVLDEAQVVKNSLSTSAKAVRRLRAEHRIALTGTPMENRLSELWSVMDFLNPGVLGTSERFRHRYAIPVERHGDTDAAQRLRQITRPYLLRRLKTDRDIVDDLPEKIEIIQDYRLTSEQASLYRTVVDDMLEKIAGTDGIKRRGTVLAAMAKLKQVCNHPAQLLHDGSPIGRRSGKVIRLEEVLAELLAEGDRALCFTQFTEFAEMLVPHLSARFDQEVLYLHGGTPRARRDEIVRRFQASDHSNGPSIFLLSLKAGGTGLNLTAANHVLHLDRWWNPAVENQATDRAFRIGQRRNVQVRKFVCAGTLEERIDQMIASKRDLADLVISDGEGWLTELSTRELRELLALGEEAIGE